VIQVKGDKGESGDPVSHSTFDADGQTKLEELTERMKVSKKF
jgi:hypothetical protein